QDPLGVVAGGPVRAVVEGGLRQRRAVHPAFPARIRFLYDGGVLGPDVLARIRLRPVELLDWRTAQRGDLRGLVKPKLRRQIKAALRALAAGTGPLELHEGRPVGHPGSPGPS
ncbi:hypothetical protein AB0D15_40455, partial [Streptomyces sp. NPDC048551]